MANQHVSQSKWKSLQQRMNTLGICSSEIQERFVKGSGKGGQKLNKTSSTVVLRYGDIVIKCGHARYRELNRYKARVRLCDEVDYQQHGDQSVLSKKAEKIRKQKARRKRRSHSNETNNDA